MLIPEEEAFVKKVYDKYESTDYQYGDDNLNPKREITKSTASSQKELEAEIIDKIAYRIEKIKQDLADTGYNFAVNTKPVDNDVITMPYNGEGVNQETSVQLAALKKRLGTTDGTLLRIPGTTDSLDSYDPDPFLIDIEYLIAGAVSVVNTLTTPSPYDPNSPDGTFEGNGFSYPETFDCKQEDADFADSSSSSSSSSSSGSSSSSSSSSSGSSSSSSSGGSTSGSGSSVLYKVQFDTNEGSSVPEQSVAKGGNAVRPDSPSKSMYEFDNWYADKLTTTLYNFNSPVTADIVIYAKWTADEDAAIVVCAVKELKILKIILAVVKVIKLLKQIIALILATIVPIIDVAQLAAGAWLNPSNIGKIANRILQRAVTVATSIVGTLVQALWDALNLDCLADITQETLAQIKEALSGIDKIKNTCVAGYLTFSNEQSYKSFSDPFLKASENIKSNYNSWKNFKDTFNQNFDFDNTVKALWKSNDTGGVSVKSTLASYLPEDIKNTITNALAEAESAQKELKTVATSNETGQSRVFSFENLVVN